MLFINLKKTPVLGFGTVIFAENAQADNVENTIVSRHFHHKKI
jgi:hypothetical protein